jgi:hypothetical protein
LVGLAELGAARVGLAQRPRLLDLERGMLSVMPSCWFAAVSFCVSLSTAAGGASVALGLSPSVARS